MASNLCKVFSEKTEAERKEIYADMMLCPVMHTDFTNARVNGKSACVIVCSSPTGTPLYFAREKKGHEGIKGTPVEDYQGILVHDHDKTFYHYGSNHQECLAHILRYLKDSMMNEPDRTWNIKMHSLIQEMIHCRNSLSNSLSIIKKLEAENKEKMYELIAKKFETTPGQL